MDVSTAITLLIINVTILSVVIIVMIIAGIVLIVKLNKLAKNVQQAAANAAHISEWFSPAKVFGEMAKAISRVKNK